MIHHLLIILKYNNMKILFSFLLVLSFCDSLQAQVQKDQPPYLTRSLASESIKNVEVQTSGGSIAVTGGNPAEARIEVYINRSNQKKGETLSKEEIQRKLEEDYNFTINISNNKVTAVAKPKNRNMDWKKALNISFKVFVPQNASTDLATSGGSIQLKNLSGTQNFTTSGGSLSVDNLSGKVKGRTSGGSIHLANSKDDMDLSTSGGSILAENCNGNLNLTTSGGSVDLKGLKGSIKAHTSGGGISGNNIEGELIASTSGGSVNLKELSCSLETETSGGNMDVSIKNLGSYVKVRNSGGNINLQLPANKGVDLNMKANQIRTATLNNFSGSTKDDELDGKLNGGGIPVTVKAGSGNINLSFQ